MKKADLAARLRATFLSELEEQVRSMNVELLALEKAPAEGEPVRSLFRSAHTLKGAARAAGFPAVEAVCHSLETLLAKARDGTISLKESDFRNLFAAVDAIDDAGDRIRAGDDLAGSPIERLRQSRAGSSRQESTRGGPAAPSGSPAGEPPAPGGGGQPEPSVSTPGGAAPASAGADRAPEGQPSAPEPGGELRVEPERIDTLVATIGQLRTTSARVSGRPADAQELHALASVLSDEWRRAVHPLRQALHESGAPESSTRHVQELADEFRRLTAHTGRLMREVKQDARAVARLTDDLGQQVRSIRMRPFAEACESLPRLVRDVASSAGKQVRLEIHGREVEADREVWKAIAEALVHLIPNAIDHGIETPDARLRSSKPAAATVRVAADVRGDRIVVTVSDDGRGLDIPALRTQLERSGVRTSDDDEEVIRLMFRGGISTRTETTMISGRGVGLDSVRHAVERARGTVRVDSRPGQGATFTLDCPLTLTGVRAVLASVGSQRVAIPSAFIRRMTRIRPEEVHRVEGRDMITTRDGPVRLVALARLLGPPLTDQPVVGTFPVLVLAAAGRLAALAVDELLDEQELLVRPLKRVRNPPAYLSGAAILPAGRVALALNPGVLIDAALEDRPHPRIAAEAESAAARRPRVLVVDDSITTRTLEQSILEAAGYEVITASDGADAWRLLQEHDCDLIVSDVEMPRMDGFALCEAVRASRRLHAVPIVLVTALGSSAQRARGLEVGADAYLPKSSFDQEELLQTIRQLIG